MTESVSMLYAGEDEPVIADYFEVDENPKFSPVEKPLSSKPLLQPTESTEAMADQILTVMRAIAELYAKNIHSATAEFLECLDKCIERKLASMPKVYHEIKSAEVVFDGKILDAVDQMTMQREMLLEEVETLTGRFTVEICEKISQTEAHVLNEDIRIQQMINEPSAELGYLMRAHAENKEMKAYLRGLKFGVDLSRTDNRGKSSKKRTSNRRG